MTTEITQIEVQPIPHKPVLEQQILCLILKNDKLMKDIVEIVSPKMFYDDLHQAIFTAMLYLYHNHIAIGYTTVIDRLQAKGIVEEEPLGYVVELGGVAMENDDFEPKIDLLIDLFRKREVYELSMDLVTKPLDGFASSNLVKKIEGRIEGMGITSNIELDNFSEYIDEWVNVLEDTETVVQNYKTGYKLLDEMLLIEPSNLMLVSARPSLGKSAFALNLTKNFCLQDKKTLFVSLEMSKREIMNRLVANLAKVEAQKLKRKLPLESSEWTKILKAKEDIKKWHLNIYDKGGMYIEQLEGLAKHLKKKDALDVIVVDYLQLLDTHSHNKNRVQQVSYISRKLKQIAMELEIPVIALSQLSRAGVTDGGKPREPQLSDLRESGSLEQDANIVLMLHSKDVNQQYQDHRFIEMFVRKNRDGRLGKVHYTYYGDYVEFVETEWSDELKRYEVVEQDDLTKPNIIINDDDLPF